MPCSADDRADPIDGLRGAVRQLAGGVEERAQVPARPLLPPLPGLPPPACPEKDSLCRVYRHDPGMPCGHVKLCSNFRVFNSAADSDFKELFRFRLLKVLAPDPFTYCIRFI